MCFCRIGRVGYLLRQRSRSVSSVASTVRQISPGVPCVTLAGRLVVLGANDRRIFLAEEGTPGTIGAVHGCDDCRFSVYYGSRSRLPMAVCHGSVQTES